MPENHHGADRLRTNSGWQESYSSCPLLEANSTGALPAVIVVCWLALSIAPLKGDADELVCRWENERERVYATAAVWAGKHIGHDVMVAANEIGAIGFFLPQPASILDLFGLLSREDQLRVPCVQRIREKLPHCIFTRAHFYYTRTIHSGTAGRLSLVQHQDAACRYPIRYAGDTAAAPDRFSQHLRNA